MRTLLLIGLMLVPSVVDAQIFGRRTTSRGVTSYTAVDGRITNTNCQCAMCDAARAAAAAGQTKVCWVGRCYPISQLTSHARKDIVSTPRNAVVAPPSRPRVAAPPADPVTKFTPTPEDAARLMVALARVTETDVVYDLGCGDGRVLEHAAAIGANCVGVEINEATVQRAKQRTRSLTNVDIRQGDMFKQDVRGADVVFLYHYPPMIQSLLPQLKTLRPGTRVVSYSHDIPDVCTQRHRIGDHVFFTWVVEDTVSRSLPSFSIASRLR